MTKKLMKTAFVLALSEVGYILLVSAFMRTAEKYLSNKPDNFFSPIAFLLLFVISAAVSASLVFGKPVLMYMDGHKREAVKLFAFILGWLLLFLILAITTLFLKSV